MEDLQIGNHTIPASELVEIFETSGGPGGQHANRTETSVRLRLDLAASSLPDEVKESLVHRLGNVVDVVASESRSQWRNRALARKRMREKIEAALVEPTTRRRTRPTRASRRRRLADKQARSETKRLRRRPDVDD